MKNELSNNYRVLIVHHNADMDGLASGAFANNLFQQIKKVETEMPQKNQLTYDIVGYNYEKFDESENHLKWMKNTYLNYDYIQFIDITPPMNWIEENINNMKIDIFDHHKSAFETIRETFVTHANWKNIAYYFDENYSGVWLYHYFTLMFSSKVSLRKNKYIIDEEIEKTWIYQRIISVLFPGKINQSSNIFMDIFGSTDNKVNHTKIFIQRLYENTFNLLRDWKIVVEIISKYDTWKWYENRTITVNNDMGSAYNPLFLNAGFMLMYKYFDNIGRDNNIYGIYNIPYAELIEKGKLLCDDAANRIPSKFAIRQFDSAWILFVNDKLNFFTTEKFKHSDSDVICYYNFDIENNKVNLSFRSLSDKVDCSALVKLFTNGNGGGHFGAAGGSMTISEFIKFFELEPKESLDFENSKIVPTGKMYYDMMVKNAKAYLKNSNKEDNDTITAFELSSSVAILTGKLKEDIISDIINETEE